MQLDMRVQVTVEALMEAHRDGFKAFPARLPELDLVEADDQITHEVTLDQKLGKHDELDVFRADPKYEENENLWKRIRAEIFGQEVESSSSSSDGSDSESESESGSSDEDEDEDREGGAATADSAGGPQAKASDGRTYGSQSA